MRPTGTIRAILRLAVLALALGLVAPAPVSAQEPPPLPQAGTDVLAQGSWIIRLVDGADPSTEAPGLARVAGGRVGLVYEHALNGFQFRGSAAAAAALDRNPRVASVQQDQAVYLTEVVPYGITRVDAFIIGGGDAYEAGFRGAGARIAVTDTGIDLDHPDLVASIDQTTGRNCLNEALPPNDGHGHGTHVAGTAAAPLNGVGVVGVAPEAQLVPVKVFDDAGNSAESLVICGIDHLVGLNSDGDPTNDVDVANMSWGEPRTWGSCETDALHGAICAASAAGIILVGGAGNNAADAGSFVPAAYAEVISVSAIADFDGEPGGQGGCAFVMSLFWYECDDSLAFFSNYGPSIDVTAPGVNVHSTWAGGGYQTIDGTSMATPHVSGIAALMVAAAPGLTPAQARDALLASGECPNGQWADTDGTPGCAGQGSWPDDPDGIAEVLPNALRAAQLVSGGNPPPPPPSPSPSPSPTPSPSPSPSPTPAPTTPTAPTLLGAPADGMAILSWTVPTDDGGSPITAYEIHRSVDGGLEGLLDTVSGIETTYIDSGLANGIEHAYRVVAVNVAGQGDFSNVVTVVPSGSATAPSAPLGLTASKAKGNTSAVILEWSPAADDGGSPVSAYFVYRQGPDAPSFTFLGSTPDGSTTTYTDTAVERRTTYTYYVEAWNGYGPSPASNEASVRTK